MRGVNYISLHDRFYMQLERMQSGCWKWTGTLSRSGYGRIKDHYRTRNAHRVSWELYFGEVPKGLFVCHKCDNRKCVNPDHLFLGTPKDNTRDSVIKGRHPHAETHNKAKLSWRDVYLIRSSTEDAREIAKRLGVHFSTVYRVRRGTFWNANRRHGNV